MGIEQLCTQQHSSVNGNIAQYYNRIRHCSPRPPSRTQTSWISGVGLKAAEHRRTPQETTGRLRTAAGQPQDAAGRPQETCKSRKDAIGHLENLNCTEMNQPLDVYTRRTRTHPAMEHFLITLCTLFFTVA